MTLDIVTSVDILQVNLPEFVSKRYDHSMAVFTVGLNCVWIVVTGGYVNRYEDEEFGDMFVTQPNITIIVKLG